jgi:hypothetical protein
LESTAYRKYFLYKQFPLCENAGMSQKGLQIEKDIVEALRKQTPVRGLLGVRIRSIRPQAPEGFDIQFEIESGDRRVSVLGEIKSELSPKLLEEIAPWIRRMKSLR